MNAEDRVGSLVVFEECKGARQVGRQDQRHGPGPRQSLLIAGGLEPLENPFAFPGGEACALRVHQDPVSGSQVEHQPFDGPYLLPGLPGAPTHEVVGEPVSHDVQAGVGEEFTLHHVAQENALRNRDEKCGQYRVRGAHVPGEQQNGTVPVILEAVHLESKGEDPKGTPCQDACPPALQVKIPPQVAFSSGRDPGAADDPEHQACQDAEGLAGEVQQEKGEHSQQGESGPPHEIRKCGQGEENG